MACFLSRRAGYCSADVKLDFGAFLRASKDGIWALSAPVIILGGSYTAIFTLTEPAVVAVVYGLLISFSFTAR